MMAETQPGVLALEDGSRFPGLLMGAPVSAEGRRRDRGYGEAVFNTSMTGYQEILTDPSYFGQIVCMTVPHIGNTGVNEQDPESARPWCAGFLVHEYCPTPSNWRASGSLDAYLKKHGIPMLTRVDTRALTLHLRSRGVVRGILLPENEAHLAQSLLKELPGFEGRDLLREVTTPKPYAWQAHAPLPETAGSGKPEFRIVALDFGVKYNLLRSLSGLGCEITVMPAQTSASEILALKPNGVFLSNGPGDPEAAPYAVSTVRELLGKQPIFGVCMGHQILALALGGKTFKMKFGHRGGNQPVFDRARGRVEISSHNHGYAVDPKSLPQGVEITHINLNDQAVEGLACAKERAFSVQYHPEACPGPHDSVVHFERFIEMMRETTRER